MYCVLQFGVVMSDVKRLPERLECMVFRVRFPEEVEELKPVSQHVCVVMGGWVGVDGWVSVICMYNN